MKKIVRLGFISFLMIYSVISFALPNPAATNCLNKGNKYLLVQNIGICLFPDDSYCEEWAYFRNQCKPGQNLAATGNNGNGNNNGAPLNAPVNNGAGSPPQ